MYVLFALVVLVADLYHRRVMLPRIQREMELRMEAERQAYEPAANAPDAFDGSSVAHSAGVISSIASEGGGGEGRLGDGLLALDARASTSSSEGFPHVGLACGGGACLGDDDRTHATAPGQMEYVAGCNPHSRALDKVLTALSNYNDDELDPAEHDVVRGDAGAMSADGPWRRGDGWGADAAGQGAPRLLRGAEGLLAKHPHHPLQTVENHDHPFDSSPYHVMEDMDMVDRPFVPDGSIEHPAYDLRGAWQELMAHFRVHWRDILEDDESGILEKFLLICEFPMTIARKVCSEWCVIHLVACVMPS